LDLKISNETKVGILSTFAIVLLVLGYAYLKGDSFFSNEMILNVEYDYTSGISKSDDVTYRGLAVGKVTSVKIKDTDVNKIIVSFSVAENLQIPIDSRAWIINADLLGEKALDIKLGDSTVFAKHGDYLQGEVERNLSQQISDELIPVKEKIEVMLSNLDSVISAINGFFTVNFQEEVDKNMQNIAAAIENIKNITYNVNVLMESQNDHIDSIMSNVELLTKSLADSRGSLENTLANLSDISDSLAQVNLVQTFNSIDSLAANLAGITDKINRGEGSLGKLLYDDKLYDKLAEASDNLNALLEDMKQHPGRYLSIIRIGK
jgi:phospholipid/cholesterol/gamma-HCH transport system substrate-binding protein